MTHLQLLPHVSVAMVEDRPIFLDLRRDRYFALHGEAANAMAALRSDPHRLADDKLAGTLIATGLFAASDEPRELLPAPFAIPDRDLPDDRANLHIKDLIPVLLLLAGCHRAVRKQPLDKVIARRRRPGAERPRLLSADAILALAQRFLRARALIPIKPVCLQDSLALHDWLAAHWARATLVIGVRLDPFAAHCWVQLGETVLNDASDRVAAYTPILVVE
ncbi:MAG: lasso peptide biosynthesis B2 protein [Pseudomonadota bacterium]